MVNSFLLRKKNLPISFSLSATLLDKKRLNKQCQEALQMINSIDDAIEISKKLKIPIPEQCKKNNGPRNMQRFLDCSEWLRVVYKTFKKEKMFLTIQQGKYYWSEKEKIGIWMTSKHKVENRTVRLYHPRQKKWLEYPIEDCIFYKEGGRVVSKNNTFLNHPCTRMWAGYLNSFKYYFNTIRKECLKRGIQCNHPKFIIEGKCPKPWWTEYFADCSMASLLRKEKILEEEKWYWNLFPEVEKTKWYSKGYIWFSNLTLKEIMEIHNGCDFSKFCSPPQDLIAKAKTLKKNQKVKEK